MVRGPAADDGADRGLLDVAADPRVARAAEGPAHPVAVNHAAHSRFRDQDRLASGVLDDRHRSAWILGRRCCGSSARTDGGRRSGTGCGRSPVGAGVGVRGPGGPGHDTPGGSRATAGRPGRQRRRPSGAHGDPHHRDPARQRHRRLSRRTGPSAILALPGFLYLTRVLGYDAGRTSVVLPQAAGALSIIGVGPWRLLLRRAASQPVGPRRPGSLCRHRRAWLRSGSRWWTSTGPDPAFTVAFSVGGVVIRIGQATSAEIWPEQQARRRARHPGRGLLLPGSSPGPDRVLHRVRCHAFAAGFRRRLHRQRPAARRGWSAFALFVRPGRPRPPRRTHRPAAAAPFERKPA
ncbi:hypothetical protein HBB16_04765 [Pseudonocardia sp. MCCB 268]|nr:hypothetical protein [Pseudonocardia cytotoxica]